MNDLKKIADQADMIVNGYAFTKDEDKIRVLRLDSPHHAVVLSMSGEPLETNMDDIELALVKKYYERNRKFMDGSLEESMHA